MVRRPTHVPLVQGFGIPKQSNHRFHKFRITRLDATQPFDALIRAGSQKDSITECITTKTTRLDGVVIFDVVKLGHTTCRPSQQHVASPNNSNVDSKCPKDLRAFVFVASLRSALNTTACPNGCKFRRHGVPRGNSHDVLLLCGCSEICSKAVPRTQLHGSLCVFF